MKARGAAAAFCERSSICLRRAGVFQMDYSTRSSRRWLLATAARRRRRFVRWRGNSSRCSSTSRKPASRSILSAGRRVGGKRLLAQANARGFRVRSTNRNRTNKPKLYGRECSARNIALNGRHPMKLTLLDIRASATSVITSFHRGPRFANAIRPRQAGRRGRQLPRAPLL